MSQPDPTFPPLLTGHDVSGGISPFKTACDRAREGKLGAGDVVWSRNTSYVDLAIILEPEVPLATALQMIPLAMVACGDCLGAVTPAQVGVTFHWPMSIRVNGGRLGGFRAAVGNNGIKPDDIPDWLVIALSLRLRHDVREPEPGHNPDITALEEEGCPKLTRSELIESYTRHFMTWLNNWQDDGFRPVHAAWLFRTDELNEEISVSIGDETFRGIFVGLDETGNLLLKSDDGQTKSLFLIETLDSMDRFQKT
ncbi:bifunctional ligase/repressor BirA [bacterium MnTg02]|nr:bifunctional ligase/repressor BirA [bacterium MnTg02]